MAFIVPLLSLLTWTLIVWWALLLVRIAEIQTKKLLPHEVNTPEEARELLSLRQNMVARNFINLTELPIIFYALCLLCIALNVESDLQEAFAWIFVGSRVLHTVIHTSYNSVLHRFYAYVLGGVVLTAWVVTLFATIVFP